MLWEKTNIWKVDTNSKLLHYKISSKNLVTSCLLKKFRPWNPGFQEIDHATSQINFTLLFFQLSFFKYAISAKHIF